MEAALLRERYESALAAIRQASEGRYAPPRIIAVTKTHPAQDILPLSDLGVTEIGENRVQEIVEKWPDLQEKFRFHCPIAHNRCENPRRHRCPGQRRPHSGH